MAVKRIAGNGSQISGRKSSGRRFPWRLAPMSFLGSIVATEAPVATILIRLMVGAVFLSEGIQKFLFPDALGVGRFIKIGIPMPQVMAPFVGAVEIGCGSLILAGLLTRPASILLIIDMLVAIATTKVPMLLESGFWKMAHEARTDYAMLLGLAFLLIVGSGRWGLDATLAGDTTAKNG